VAKYAEEDSFRARALAPRSTLDMPPLLPDGTAFDSWQILDRVPR